MWSDDWHLTWTQTTGTGHLHLLVLVCSCIGLTPHVGRRRTARVQAVVMGQSAASPTPLPFTIPV
jgi:hypothetical protein